jgi:hypothetical protein
MSRTLLFRFTLALLAAVGVGGLALHSGAAGSSGWSADGPGNRLLGRELEPDAGPLPPGTPPQPPPALCRGSESPSRDPMEEMRRLKRRAETAPGATLGPLPADARRYRQLVEQWRGPAPAVPHRVSPSLPSPPGHSLSGAPSARVASVPHSLWADVIASPVAWGKIPLHAGRPVTIEVQGVIGGKPLLYLIKGDRQVAFGGDSATIAYTPPADGDYQFLVRGAGDGSLGFGDLYVDGALLFGSITFGGTAVPATWAPGDEFQTAHRPAPANALVDTVLYAFDGQGQFVARNDDGGINGCSRLVMGTASTRPDPHILIACAGQSPADGGLVRLYANPLSQGDPDGDHLATPLEAALGTDPNAADTDGDGLRDDWEVFGLHTPDGDEDLPAYSDPWTAGPAADPTRMDLFLELDWMGGADGDPNHFRVTDAALQRLTQAMKDHGGVALHVDAGQMGTRASRGGQSFAYQSSFYFTRTTPLSMQDLWANPDQFAASRRHLFVYALCIDRFAPGQNTTGETRRLYENGRVINTSEVWNPRYTPGFLICNGTGLYNHPASQAAILMHELGHCLHLRHGGNVDTNNKPNYISVMNYLFALPTLSDDGDIDYSHGGLSPLDEHALVETTGIGFAPPAHLYRLIEGQNRADVRSSSSPAAIDWNDNGRLDSGPVEADINGDGVEEVLSDFNDWREVKRPTRGFGWVGLNAGIDDWVSYNDAP